MTDDLFSVSATCESSAKGGALAPLAEQLRPLSLDDYRGQSHLLGPDKPLRQSIEQGQPHSMILWGPPGTGKTTLARLIAHYTECHFIALSAVLSGVKDIRDAVEQAKQAGYQGHQTLVFVDEVHRFNKSQQDAFLPHIEDGTFIFIGATTENPSFELNNALLSRCRIYILKSLQEEALLEVLEHGQRHLKPEINIDDEFKQMLVNMADGDARRCLNMLQISHEYASAHELKNLNDTALLLELFQDNVRRFDNKGDVFYEQISALHKAVRGSSPDASLYWLCRMLDGGCDPVYILRRVVRMASEDIGNADPRALSLAMDAWQTYERLGSPEGELALAQAVVYCASAAKSNAVYQAFNATMALVKSTPSYEVPLHLRNAPTQLMKEADYGREYRYAHNEPDAYATGENYFPEALAQERLYTPVNRGLEAKIAEKLEYLRRQDAQSSWQRYASQNTSSPESKGNV